MTDGSGHGGPGGPSARGIAGAVRAGELDPVRVAEDALRRIAERNDAMGAFIAVREAAVADAGALARRDDLDRLPLAGVPVGVKDVIDVAGLPTRHGAVAAGARPAERDHPLVTRLRDAGAIIVGKTTLPELAIWAATDGPWGVARNPRSPQRTPGGSSGGSAAAVAAGLVPLALGSDGLGSIRIPAAATGLAGLKPGLGSGAEDTGPLGWYGMVSFGFLGADVADAALGTAALLDRPALVGAGAAEGESLRIAVSTRNPLPGGSLDPEWAAAVGDAARRLARAGHEVERADPPYSSVFALPVFARWFAGVARAAETLETELAGAPLQRRTRTHARLGRWIRRLGGPPEGLAAAWRERTDAFLGRYDILLTPALAHPPIPALAWHERGWLANVRSNARYAPYSAIWNLAGVPAGSVPFGNHSDGTPLGVQVVARRGREDLVLRAMGAVQRVAVGPAAQAARA